VPRQPCEPPVPGGGAEPFRLSLPESLLADLHERLERTPGAHALAGRDPGLRAGLRDEPLLRERARHLR
jgi:hypothetical protein